MFYTDVLTVVDNMFYTVVLTAVAGEPAWDGEDEGGGWEEKVAAGSRTDQGQGTNSKLTVLFSSRSFLDILGFVAVFKFQCQPSANGILRHMFDSKYYLYSVSDAMNIMF